MFTFRIAGTPPPLGFRVGIAFDGLDGAQYSPQEIRLTQTTGGAASASVNVEPFRNNTLDMAFFDVTGAAVDDRFTVQGVAGAGGYATHQIVTWDAITLPPAPLAGGESIGIDLANGPNTPGAGVEPNFNLITGNGTIPAGSVVNTNGNPIANVSITATGIAGQMGENNLGFGAGTGDYTGTPFSDLTFDDGVFTNGASGQIDVTLSGLDDSMTYDILGIAGGPGTANTTVDFTIGGTTQSQTYNEFRSGGVLHPLSFNGIATDGAGNLTITMDANTWYGVSGLHVTANAPEGDRYILTNCRLPSSMFHFIWYVLAIDHVTGEFG